MKNMKRMHICRIVCLGLLMMQTAFAMAANDGYSKADPILFDWDNGHEQEPITVVDPQYPDIVDTYNFRWYKVGLEPLYEEDNPVLALYLTNLEDDTVKVKMVAQLESQTEEREYTLTPYGFKIWSISAVTLIKMKTQSVMIQLTSDHRVALSAKVYENIRLDQTCTSSTLLDWSGTHQTAKSAWYVLQLNEAMASATQKVVLRYTNNGGSAVQTTVSRSADCPSTGSLTIDTLLSAGATYEQEITRASLEVLEDSLQYIHVEANGAIDISASLETEDLSGQEIHGTATLFSFDMDYSLSAGVSRLFYIPMSVLRSVPRYAPLFVALNGGNSDGTIAYKYAFKNPSNTSMLGEVNIAAASDASLGFAANAIEAVSSDVENVYFEITPSVAITLRARMRHIYEGATCKYPIAFDYEHSEKYTPGSELWYGVMLEDLLALRGDVTMFIANHNTSSVKVKMERALECPFVVTEPSEHTIAAGDTLRIELPYGFYSNLKYDAIYYGLEASKELEVWATVGEAQVKRPAVMACESAQTFNWLTGHRQDAGEKWYVVEIDTIRKSQFTPQILVRNLTGSDVTYMMEVSYECPDSLSNLVVEHTIPAYDRYLSESIREQVVNLKADIHEVYVHMVSDGEIAIEVQFVRPEEGKSCLTAVPFNYVSGHDQLPNEDLWYAIDIREAKSNHKDAVIHVYNRTNEPNPVEGFMSDECPCEAPQYLSYVMTPNEHRERKIVHSLLKNFGDTIYLRVKNTGIVHFEAEFVDPTPIYLDACNEADSLIIGHEYNCEGGADTLWFYMRPEQIQSDNFSPIIVFKDRSGASNAEKVHFAFNCPVTEQMFERALDAGNMGTKRQVIERTTVQSLASNDTIYLMITANKASTFMLEMADANTGEDCMHAQMLRNGDAMRIGKGVQWYRYDLHELPENVNAHLILRSAKETDTVSCILQNDCDGVAIRTYKDTLALNGQRIITTNAPWLSGFTHRYIYYRVETTDSTDVLVNYTPMVSTDSVYTCEKAKPMAINSDYPVAAGDTAWFWVNIADLRVNTSDDLKWIVKNEGTTVAHAERATAWSCPTAFDLLPEPVSVPAEGTVETVYPHAYLNAIVDSIAYVRVTADQDVKVQLNVNMTRGEDCIEPVVFDWVNGNVHPADEWIWYQVRMDSTKIPVDKDIRLNIKNLADETTEASAFLFFDCRDASLADSKYTFQPGDSKFKDIDRSLLKNLGWADMIIRYHSSNNTQIKITLVDSVAVPVVHDSVFAIVCDGEDYTDTITGEIHTIFFDELADRHWTDERDTLVKAFYEHRITDFFITARRDPDAFTESELETFKPIMREGMPIFVDSSLMAINRYYESIASDSLALIDTIYWAVPTGSKSESSLNVLTPVERNTPSKELRLVVKTQCGTTVRSDVAFMIDEWRTDSITLTDTICAGESITLQDGTTVAIERDTVIRDLVSNVEALDTLLLPRKVDSIYVRDVRVRVKPEFVSIDDDGNIPIVMQLGAGIDLEPQWNNLSYQYETDDPMDVWVDSIGFERKIDDVYVSVDPEERLDSTVREVTLRYVLFTDCGDTLYSPDKTVTPLPYTRISTTVQDVLCAGETYEPRLSPTFVMKNDTMFNDTVKWIIPENGGAAFDSIYVYDIRLLPPTTSTTEVEVCRRDQYYTWHVEGGDTTILHEDFENSPFTIIRTNSRGCDSIMTLVLHLLENTESTTEVEVCRKDESYTWHVEGGDTTIMHADFEKGPFTIVRTNSRGCDSIMTLVLNLLENTESTTEVTICGDDIPYTWHVEGGDTTINDLKGGTYTIVRTNADGCDSIMTLVLNVNQPHYDDLPIETHFGNRVLVINRASIESETGWHVESSQVNWYKVGTPDELVREGSDYYTTGEPIVGSYYATIYTPAQQKGDCSTYGRSITIVCAENANAPEEPTKEIRDGQLFIRRNGVLYTTEGLPLVE